MSTLCVCKDEGQMIVKVTPEKGKKKEVKERVYQWDTSRYVQANRPLLIWN